jgi:hypothetical protein
VRLVELGLLVEFLYTNQEMPLQPIAQGRDFVPEATTNFLLAGSQENCLNFEYPHRHRLTPADAWPATLFRASRVPKQRFLIGFKFICINGLNG